MCRLKVSIQQFSETDRDELAMMHLRCLPDSAVARLGVSFTAALYAFAAKSPREAVLIATLGDALVGGALLSTRPRDLARRMAVRCPGSVLKAAPRIAMTLLSGRLRKARSKTDEVVRRLSDEDTPELVYLFSAQSARGVGVGAALVDASERWAHSLHRLYVKTGPNKENPARGFYKRMGFETCGLVEQSGEIFELFGKKLP